VALLEDYFSWMMPSFIQNIMTVRSWIRLVSNFLGVFIIFWRVVFGTELHFVSSHEDQKLNLRRGYYMLSGTLTMLIHSHLTSPSHDVQLLSPAYCDDWPLCIVWQAQSLLDIQTKKLLFDACFCCCYISCQPIHFNQFLEFVSM